MKLFLASEAKHPETIMKLDKYIGGFTGKKIAYLPTAANGEGWGSWKNGGSWNLVQSLDANISLIQLEDYPTSEILEKLENKDILWFAGGFCGYLMYWMRRKQLDKHLHSLLKKGKIYVGSSAGSMVTGKSLDIAEWYLTDQEWGASFIPALGLVDFDIYPHFEDGQLKKLKRVIKGINYIF